MKMRRTTAVALSAALSGVALAVTGIAASPTKADTGPVNLYNLATGKCADIPGYEGGSIDGPVNQFTCNYSDKNDNQRWEVIWKGKREGRDSFLIKNVKDGYCLDLPFYEAVAPGTPVSEYPCAEDVDHDNQLFYEREGQPGSPMLINLKSGLCLDVAGVRTGGNDARLTLASCSMKDDHLWSLVYDEDSARDAPTYYRMKSRQPVRTATTGKAPAMGAVGRNEVIQVLCQDTGARVDGSLLWNYIQYTVGDSWDTSYKKRGWVPDAAVDTGTTNRLPNILFGNCPKIESISRSNNAIAPPVADLYKQAYDVAFGPLDAHYSRSPQLLAPETGDDGLVVVRWYIPDYYADPGVHFLYGDNRGPSTSPEAPYRVTYTWDVRSGRAVVTVAPSEAVGAADTRGNSQINPARPVVVRATSEEVRFWADSIITGHETNDVSATSSASGRGASTTTWVSLVNSYEAHSPSIDGKLSVARRASGGGYQVSWTGNGYPAMEAHYYPRYNNKSGVDVVARRSVEPGPLGATALLDHLSWVNCQTFGRALFCSDRGPTHRRWVTTW